jgi:hypothetical protein
MSLKYLLALGSAVAIVAGCESGDIDIQPSTNVTDSNNTTNTGGGGDGTNPCASYLDTSGQVQQGAYDGKNCTYSTSFARAGKPIAVDLTIPALTDGGAHIFQGSLFIGRDYKTNAELDAAGVHEGGDGPSLTIEAGATVAFDGNQHFMIINRGSRLFAVGTPEAPITFTSLSDVNGEVGPEDVEQWGGIIINGFGVTNKCKYTGTAAGGDLALDGECHVLAEGGAGLDESHFGGGNNDDSSGDLEYVIVKHTGAQVANGDELNGISWDAVGRNTIAKNIEAYSTFDDGMEFFGGAVDIENYLAVYVRDDSIDIDDGYSGTITNALVIQSATRSNHCIESDGIGSYENLDAAARQAVIDQGINSRPTIDHLTCIVSPHLGGEGTASVHGPGAGWLFREGIYPTVKDSMVVGSFAANDTTAADDNYCLRIDGDETQNGALNGAWSLAGVVIACAERTRGQTFPDGTTTEESWAAGQGVVFATIPSGTAVNPTPAADPDLQLLQGTPPIYSIPYASMLVDGALPPGGPTQGDFIGALIESADWTQPWAYGIQPDKRGEDLWFAVQ